MRKYYIKNFPLPHKEHIDKMLPSEEDDKVAARGITIPDFETIGISSCVSFDFSKTVTTPEQG